MAGHWIEWEKGLTRKPEVLQIARALKINCCEAAARCMLVWEWMDDSTTDGIIEGCDRDTIDEIAGLAGFSNAMEATRPHPWISFDDVGLTVANFDRHNGECSKKRAIDAKRKRDARRTRTNVRTDADKCPKNNGHVQGYSTAQHSTAPDSKKRASMGDKRLRGDDGGDSGLVVEDESHRGDFAGMEAGQ
jgi:hypothetical protein